MISKWWRLKFFAQDYFPILWWKKFSVQASKKEKKRNGILCIEYSKKYPKQILTLFYFCFITEQHLVTRTCISEIQINYFMVDQVCMSESNRRGFLCFCNDSLCNTSAPNINYKASSIFIGLIASMWVSFAFRWSNMKYEKVWK